MIKLMNLQNCPSFGNQTRRGEQLSRTVSFITCEAKYVKGRQNQQKMCQINNYTTKG